MAKLANAKGEMVYFNLVQKNGKLQWVIKGIGDTVVLLSLIHISEPTRH